MAEEVKHVHTIGIRTDGKSEEIPASFRDLAECPAVAALTTVTADGYPHTSVVWCDFDGECIRVNTMRGFVKDRNMRRDPRVTLLCYDPHEPLRYLEVRGRVIDITEVGAGEHLDGLASKYAGRPTRFFGGSVPARFAQTEIPVIFTIRPVHVVAVDATTNGRTA
jgi:PPOX class probable F420-dependent enzyme